MNKNIKFTFPAQREFVSVARLLVSGLAPTLPFDEETVEDVKIALSEVCSTVILNLEQQQQTTENILLHLTVTKDFLQMDIDTKEIAIDLSSFTPLVWADPKEPGFGLSIVTALMDKVEFVANEKGQAVLRLKKFFP